MSSRTRSLQLQLFRALVAQTCLPMFMMYIPIGFMFSCPYFDLQLGAITNYQTVMAQLYPGIDPFVVLLIIDSYRKTILCKTKILEKKQYFFQISAKICPRFIYTRSEPAVYDLSTSINLVKVKPSLTSSVLILSI